MFIFKWFIGNMKEAGYTTIIELYIEGKGVPL